MVIIFRRMLLLTQLFLLGEKSDSDWVKSWTGVGTVPGSDKLHVQQAQQDGGRQD